MGIGILKNGILLALVGALLLAGCSRDENSFRSLNLSVGTSETGDKVAPKAIVVGDVNSPQIANFLKTKGYEVTDVPYVAFEASDQDMNGDYIVWSDDRNGNRDIYAYQISTKTEFPITTAAGDQTLPKISGDYIVWQDSRNGNPDIYAYQISTKTELAIAVDGARQSYPEIDGDYIVWQDQRNGLADIYAYRISTAQELVISQQEGEQWQPKVAGDYIVWQSYVDGFSDIYGYRISSATLFPISTASGSQYQPVLSERYVVWLDNSSGDDNLYAYDLANSRQIAISTAAGQQWRAQVQGDYVVWQDFRNGNFDIYAYQLSTQTEIAVTTNPATQSHPVVSGDLIAWQDYRNGQYDIYAYQISTGVEFQITSDGATQSRPIVNAGYISWLDARRGVVDVMLRNGVGGDVVLATNTWYTPAGTVNDESGYDIADHDVAILGSNVASSEIMLDVFDAADKAGVPMLAFGGTGVSLASALAAHGRYGVQVTPDSGCSRMRIYVTEEIYDGHTLATNLLIDYSLDMEQEGAEAKDELAINTDASAADTPLDWTVLAVYHENMCNAGEPAVIEFTTQQNSTKVILDGAANVGDQYRYWSNTRWTFLTNELAYLRGAIIE